MKTYHSNSKNTSSADKKGFLARNLYGFVLAGTALVLATVVGVSLILGNRDTKKPIDDQPVASLPVYVMPLADFTLGSECVLTRLVYQPTLNQWRTHNGVDFLTQKGSTVMAIRDGTVTSVEDTILEGTVVTVSHGSGIVSIYKSLDSEVSVTQGQAVSAGDPIGKVGDPMVLQTSVGNHLYLEMRQNNKLVDPMNYLPAINK